jgi:hypothetical protein
VTIAQVLSDLKRGDPFDEVAIRHNISDPDVLEWLRYKSGGAQTQEPGM